MPTIITPHMAKPSANSRAPLSPIGISHIARELCSALSIAAVASAMIARYSHARETSSTKHAPTNRRSRRARASCASAKAFNTAAPTDYRDEHFRAAHRSSVVPGLALDADELGVGKGVSQAAASASGVVTQLKAPIPSIKHKAAQPNVERQLSDAESGG